MSLPPTPKSEGFQAPRETVSTGPPSRMTKPAKVENIIMPAMKTATVMAHDL